MLVLAPDQHPPYWGCDSFIGHGVRVTCVQMHIALIVADSVLSFTVHVFLIAWHDVCKGSTSCGFALVPAV